MKYLKSLLALLLAAAFVAAGLYANFCNRTTQQHTVLSIDKIEATEGNSDGFKTRIYYQVSTDKGAYHIRTAGLNAAPQCAGIKKDSTYTLVTQGVSVPFIGVYPCIVEIVK